MKSNTRLDDKSNDTIFIAIIGIILISSVSVLVILIYFKFKNSLCNKINQIETETISKTYEDKGLASKPVNTGKSPPKII